MEQTGQRDGGRLSGRRKSEVGSQKVNPKRPDVKTSGWFVADKKEIKPPRRIRVPNS
jgi:hypothetical protein